MKFLHTADWHLGSNFHGHSRTEEHRHFLLWLLRTLREREPDALLIAGDVFDTPNPSAEAESLFFTFLHEATEAVPGLQIVVTSGNHDSGGRIDAPATLLRAHRVYVRGLVRRTDDEKPDYDYHILPLSSRHDSEAQLVVFALPFLRSTDYAAGSTMQEALHSYVEKMRQQLRRSPFRGLPVVVCAHFYASGADISASHDRSERLVVGGQDCVEAEAVSEGTAYVALGHIHKAQQVDRHSWYAGSALPMSFAEKHYRHGVLEVDVNAEGHTDVTPLPYDPLRTLLSIPDRGAATAGEVLEAIAKLPKRGKSDTGSDWPYLEIRVRETQPEPSLLREVTAALQDHAVRFCRMVRETDRPSADDAIATADLQALHTITPAQLLERTYNSRYGEDLPEPMLERFRQAEAQIADE